jgi:hypothetical protein
MFKITVNTTRSAMLCLATACFANTAQADITGIPGAVSDALLASTRAANLQQSVVANLSGAAPAGIAPVNATNLASSSVRLWDEVIPPAPAPKPTQASMISPNQPRTTVATSAYAPYSSNASPALASGMQTTSLKANASVSRMPSGMAH